VIVDNDSSDGSCELLLQQPDVDVYHAAGSYERQETSGCCMSMPTNSSSMAQCEKYPLPSGTNLTFDTLLEALKSAEMLVRQVYQTYDFIH